MTVGIVLSALLGLAISGGSPIGLAVSILAPVVWLRQDSRSNAYVCAAAYYLAALRSLLVVSRNFFGPESGFAEGLCLWIVVTTSLSFPWLWAWSRSRGAALWKCPLALLLTIVPPLGLIGWASPSGAAGLLFPGTGYVGFALTLLVPGLLINGRGAELAVLVAVIHLLASPEPQPPEDWEAINTNFGSVDYGAADFVREYQIGRELQARALQSKSKVIIFPEAVATGWVGELFQSTTKTVLVGAVEPEKKSFDFGNALAALHSSPISNHPAEWTPYKNEVLVRGAQTGDFLQRVPIPIGMWKPFTNGGVLLNLTGPGTTVIAGRRVAVIICYEQLITWPAVASFLDKPSIVVAISNNVWVIGTAIPKIEQTIMRSWASLFQVPVLFASNT